MTTALQKFDYQGTSLHVLEDNGEWFIAGDVCCVLGLEHLGSALRMLDEDEKGVRIVHTLGGPQKVSVINESGLYTLTMRSNKPQAKVFRKWVTGEVLPKIRKTGQYATKGINKVDALLQAVQILHTHEQRLDGLEERVGLLDGSTGYTSLAVYIKRERFKYPGGETAKAMGTYASKLSRELGEPIEKVPHAQYGTVNGYTDTVCARTCAEFGLRKRGA